MKALFRKHANGLYPADPGAEGVVARTKMGEVVEVEVRKPRNQGHLRFWWSLVDFLAEQISDDEWTKDTTADMLKIGCGHYTLIVTPSGKPFHLPKSISFSNMSQDEFVQLTEKALRVSAKILERFGQQNWTTEEIERCRKEFEARWG